MKAGERRAVVVVLAILLGVGALTAYMELYQGERIRERMAQVAGERARDRMAAVARIPRNMNPADLPEAGSRGARALATYCVQCHDLPVPAMHTAEEWRAVLARMERRIRERRGGPFSRVAMPSREAWAALEAYLARHAQRPLDPARLPDLDSAGGRAFREACSRCHAPPDPAQHRAAEWPRVLLRMQANMADAGLRPPDPEAARRILAFLQRHASDAPPDDGPP